MAEDLNLEGFLPKTEALSEDVLDIDNFIEPIEDAPTEDISLDLSGFLPKQEKGPVYTDPEGDPSKLTGVAELGLSMTTGFIGAVPGAMIGAAEAIRQGDIGAYTGAFEAIQEAFTYQARTESGERVSNEVASWFEAYSSLVDKYLVEPNDENNNLLLAAIGKVSGEAAPYLLPFLRVGKKGKVKPTEFEEGPSTKGSVTEGDFTATPAKPLRPISLYPEGLSIESLKTTVKEVVPDKVISTWESATKAFNDSAPVKGWKSFAQPLQAGSIEAATWAKNWANNEFLIIDKAKSLKKELGRETRETRKTMINALEDLSLRDQLNPKQLKIVEDMQHAMDNILGPQAIQLDILQGIRKNYAKHVVEGYMKDKKLATKLFGATAYRTYIKTGKRKHATFAIGREAGVKYHEDFNVMVAARMELEKAINNKMHVNALLKDAGEGVVGQPGQFIEGFVQINHPAFNQRMFSETKFFKDRGKKVYLDKGKIAKTGEELKTEGDTVFYNGKVREVFSETRITDKPILVAPDWAPALKAILDKPEANLMVNAMIKTKAASMVMIMFNPLFHGFTVMTKVLPAAPVKAFTSLYTGYKLNRNKVYREEAIAHNLRPMGGRGYQMDMYGEVRFDTKNILHRVDPKLGDLFEKAGEFWHDTLLWDRIGDLQMGLYDHFWKQGLKKETNRYTKEKGRSPTKEEIEVLTDNAKYTSAEMSNLLVGAFGKEEFGRYWRNTLNSVLFSRSFTMSNLRLGKYAMGVMPKHLLGQMKAVDGAVGFNKAAAIRGFTGVAFYTLMKDLFLAYTTLYGLNYIYTKTNNIPDKTGKVGGHFPDDNGPGSERKIAIDVKPDGTVIQMGNPFRAARDISEVVESPHLLASNKANPVLKGAWELLNNRDWTGKVILSEGGDWFDHAEEGATFLAKKFSGYDSFVSSVFPDKEDKENMLRLTGLQISRSARGGYRAQETYSIMKEQQQLKDMLIAEATTLWRNDNKEEALKLLITEGSFTSGELANYAIKKEFPYEALKLSLRKGKLKKLYIKATPEQKERLNAIMW